MGISCISKQYLRGEALEQFNKLQDHFKWSEGLTAAMIGAWQTFTNSKNDAFPAIHELETFSGKYANTRKDLEQVPFVQRYQKLKDLLNELRHQHLMDEDFHTELTAYKPKQRTQIRTILNEIGSKYGFRITVEDHFKYHPYKPEIFGLHNLRINGVDPESLYKEYETYYQQLWADYQKTLKVDEYYSTLTDDEILSNEALKAQEWRENRISYEGINVLSFKNKRCLVLNEKDSQAFSNYLIESRGVLPKEFVLLNSGLTLIKSNNRRNSHLYTIVNKYGEVLYEKYPVYTKDEYDLLKEKRKEAMEGPSGLYLDKLPSIRHSLAFRKFITSPSKGLFKKSAKDFLRNYIKANYEAEKVPINMDFIDRFVDQFPDSFWNSVITNTLALNRLYSKIHSGRLGLTTRGTATSYALEEYTMPLTISKRRLLTLIEKELNKEGKSIYGKFSFEGPINENMPYNDLKKSLVQQYEYFYGRHESTEEKIARYAADNEMSIEAVKEHIKQLKETEDMLGINEAYVIENYSRMSSMIQSFEKEYDAEFREYIREISPLTPEEYIDRFSRGIHIFFTKDSTLGTIGDALTTILHEPWHALEMFHGEDLYHADVLDKWEDFINTKLGDKYYSDYKTLLLRIDPNLTDEGVRDEFLADLFSVMCLPKDFRTQINDESRPGLILRMINDCETSQDRAVKSFWESLLKNVQELMKKFFDSIDKIFEFILEKNLLKENSAITKEFDLEANSKLEDLFASMEAMMRSDRNFVKISDTFAQSHSAENKVVPSQSIDTHQEDNPEVPSLTQQMHQTWTPQIIQYRALRVARIFRTIVTELENQLPEIEKRATSAATRKYIIAERYGAGNILTKVRERIASTYANEDWVKNFVHSLYEEEDWSSASCLKDIHDIHEQGNLMLTYFEPLCLEASNEIKRLESVSILTKDGEVIDLSEEEILDDEEAKTKHEEGWFHEAHEQSIEETLDREVTSILSDIYETDSDGDYTRFDDMEQPIPLDFNVVLATTAEVVGKCTVDSQMVPALQKATSKYPWMQQIIDALCGKDNATSKLYQGLSDEDVRLKTLSLQAKFWNGLHKVYVNIAEQIANDEESENNAKGPITSRIVNRKEGEEALYRQFERNCYENKTLFTSDRKPYASVYRADGSFDQKVYDSIHAEIQKSNLYNNMLTGKLSDADFALIDRALKSFGVDINIDNLKKLFDFSQEVSTEQANNIEDLRKVLFGFYAANKGSNEPLKSVMNPAESANIFDAFNENYRILARIFGDDTMGFEESAGRLMVDNENKSLFSRILPNPIHTIINKLKNSDGISEENYQARIQRDYGHNWWFAPKQDASGKGLFRKGVLKDLLEIPATRLGLRVKTLKASQGISYAQEIDAQAEETRLNEFENTRRTVGGVEFRDYSVPAFSDTAESYYMSLRYFNIKDATQRQELISRLAEVVRQEIDRINVVEARAAKGDAVKPIAAFDIKFKDGKRVKDGTDGSYFHFLTSLNKVRDNFLEKYQKLSTNPDEQQRFLNQAIEWALGQEFNFYLSQYNQWQVNALPHSQHTEPREGRAGLIDVIEKNTPAGLPQELSTQLASILNQLRHDTMTQETFNNLKDSALAILSYNNDNEQWKATLKATLDSFTLDTTNLDKLQDYFWNSFYANTQIIQLTMRDPAFLGTTDKFQKRMKMFYSPVATCYTSHYMYDENGNLQLQDSKKADSLTKETEYSLTLKDDEIAQALSYDNVKLAIEKRVVDGYLTSTQAEEILKNLTKINIADAQCYRTLPSWQKCLNMIGQGYNPKMQKAINRLSNPEKYGEWSYDDYNVVWQVFKPFVSSYTTVDSGLEGDQAFNAQFSNIEVPVQHKNAEFLLLAMYSQLSGALKNNWKLKTLNEFMVKHGIDKVQFESAVKVSNQAPIDLNSCATPEEITATLEGTTGLNGELQAENGDMQVVHSIPFRDWGISTSMPEHLLEHEESSMGTQLLKIIMEGLAETPNKTLRVGNTEKTYAQWLQLYQAIHTQNLKDAFSEVNEIFSDTRELAAYLKRQILTQNKYSHELIAHLELDENGNFKYPIIDPLLRSQFDALCASLVRNRVTKRPFRLGALPQVASWGFDLQLRFKDKDGNLILTEEEFNKRGEVTINGVTYHSWQEYQDYKKDNCTNLAYMEVLLPPFDNNFMGNINDAFIYKEDVVDGNGRVIHKSGEFNHELFSKKVSKKLLEVLINRVPTETKHSMVPAYVKGFLPSQNSSCIVVPGEWIAISDSDNDGDKCYTYFYKSRVVWDMERIKRAFAESKGFTYQSQSQRAKDMSKNSFKSTDRAKSEALDILYDELVAGRDQASTKELKDFIATSKGNAEFIKTIKPVEFKRESLERLEGETDSQYQQRVDLASIASNSHDARNNFMLELMISVLQTEDNTAQILIPGGFPIVKKVAEEMKKLMRVDDDACSICNPAIRTIHQVRNMAGANLIGVYANHRSFRPLMEQANLTLHPNNRPTINGNKSLPKDKGVPTWSMSALKNGAREFISDNISNFSGCSVDNAKDPKLGFLGQNEVTAPISMMLIHTGYTIREVAAFMNQPAIKECVREYLLSGRKGFLEDIVASHIKTLGEEAKGATEDPSVVAELNMSMLDDQISRNAQGILPDANDNLIQLTVLENFAKILPASRAIQNLITVTKADTQIGALRARSSENKLRLQTMERLAMKVNQSSFPIQGAADLVPELYAESDVTSAKLPQVAAFRYYGIQSIANFMKNISLTFNSLVDEVHEQALDLTEALSLDKDTVDNLTNATASYIFSGIGAFTKMSRATTIRRATAVLNEIKQKGLIQGNALINDLTVNIKGTKYSKRMPFIKLSKNVRKNQRAIENYQRAWEALLANGDTKIQLENGTITYKELSDLLLHYCFLTRGLNVGGNSFIQAFPVSRIADIEGYNELLQRVSSLRGDMETASTILDQYVANHPEDYHFVHRVNTKNFSIQNLLDTAKVVPSMLKIDAFTLKNSEFYSTTTDMYGQKVYNAYPYLYFRDKVGRRYLYKGTTAADGSIIYRRMQVLGNAAYGYLEEYEQGKSVMFGDSNGMTSMLATANSNMVMTSELKNAVDVKVQEAAQKGEVLSQDDIRQTIESMVGSNVQLDIVVDSYETKKKDLTGMEFCVTIS